MAAGSSDSIDDVLKFLDIVFVFEVSWLILFVGIAAAYIIHYVVFVVNMPSVHARQDSRLFRTIRKHCPILFQSYWPTLWGYNGHMTSIVRARLQQSLPVDYDREVLCLSDGGEIALDWVAESIKQSQMSCDDTSCSVKGSPVLLILPGLTGDITHNYIRHFSIDGLEMQFLTVVFSQRGNGGIKLKTTKTYCAADTQDLREVLSHIRAKYPTHPIFAVGVSIGGVLLTRYLFESGDESLLSGVVVISSLWDGMESRKALSSFPNKQLYNHFLASKMKRMILRHQTDFEPHELDFNMDSVHKVTTLEDFDEQVTIKVFNYMSVQDYYKDSTNKDRISGISTPLIAINAADDPFAPKHSLPIKEFQGNPCTALVITERGGHFGFIEGLLPFGQTWMDRALRQCMEALRNYHSQGEL